jgi:hypothetical protein
MGWNDGISAGRIRDSSEARHPGLDPGSMSAPLCRHPVLDPASMFQPLRRHPGLDPGSMSNG